jgi:hypothetical protein
LCLLLSYILGADQLTFSLASRTQTSVDLHGKPGAVAQPRGGPESAQTDRDRAKYARRILLRQGKTMRKIKINNSISTRIIAGASLWAIGASPGVGRKNFIGATRQPIGTHDAAGRVQVLL